MFFRYNFVSTLLLNVYQSLQFPVHRCKPPENSYDVFFTCNLPSDDFFGAYKPSHLLERTSLRVPLVRRDSFLVSCCVELPLSEQTFSVLLSNFVGGCDYEVSVISVLVSFL
ncbi:hypothetical protein K7432_010616 [Basidiobolus ranarum]|uniref:Uncharacterized protein n=1 Tax=Basidiobolus ranarum TaxID=34480 RepID=A0ABR2WNF4_9FUNG